MDSLLSEPSIAAASAMTYAGARGETAAEMAEALPFTLPDGRMHDAFQALLDAIHGAGRHHELDLANGPVGSAGLRSSGGVPGLGAHTLWRELREVDFEQEAEPARQEINPSC